MKSRVNLQSLPQKARYRVKLEARSNKVEIIQEIHSVRVITVIYYQQRREKNPYQKNYQTITKFHCCLKESVVNQDFFLDSPLGWVISKMRIWAYWKLKKKTLNRKDPIINYSEKELEAAYSTSYKIGWIGNPFRLLEFNKQTEKYLQKK